VQLPDAESHAHRGCDKGERDEEAELRTRQRTSTSNMPVSTRSPGFTWTQRR
jgi:hypothetical protein